MGTTVRRTRQPARRTGQPAPRWGRQLVIIALFVLLAGGGFFLWQTFGTPHLTPVTERDIPEKSALFFSAFGSGYPALQAEASGESFWYDQFQWLADDGSPLPQKTTMIFDAIGPKRDYVVTAPVRGFDRSPYTSSWRDGRQTPYPAPPRSISLPSGKLELSCQIHSEDPNLAVYHYSAGARRPYEVALYDLARGKDIASFGIMPTGEGIIFHRGERILFAQRRGMAMVLEQDKVLNRFSAPWRWGEDGTVWTNSDKQLKVLRWQEGTPELAALPMEAMFDPRVQYFGDDARISAATNFIMPGFRPTDGRMGWMQPFHDPASVAAVWGDGQLAAITTTDPPFQGSRPGDPPSTPAAESERVLTLYRKGKRVDSFRVMLDSDMMFSKVNHFSNEHLSFSGDGKYLSWVIETKLGVKLYVFRTR